MRYFDSTWNEYDRLPDDAKLLVRAVGLYHVELITSGLRENSFPFYTALERKDDVSFYVPKERHEEITKAIRQYSTARQYKDAANGNHPDNRIS